MLRVIANIIWHFPFFGFISALITFLIGLLFVALVVTHPAVAAVKESLMLRVIANIIWHFPFFGFISALITFLIGLLFVALVVTAPIGFGLIQYSKFLLLPFSYTMVKKSDVSNEEENPVFQTYGTILKILYILFFGWWLTIIVICQMIGCFITILGIPAGVVLAKSLDTILQPVGKICAPVAHHHRDLSDDWLLHNYFRHPSRRRFS